MTTGGKDSSAKKKGKRKKSSKRNDAVNLEHGTIERNLINYLTRESNEQTSYGLGLFCKEDHELLRLGIYKEKESAEEYKIVLFKDGGLVQEISIQSLAGEIDRRLEIFGEYPETLTEKYCLSTTQTDKLTKRILRSQRRRIKEWPEPLGFKSSEGVFFTRRPFDPVRGATEKDFPEINSYLSRMKNRKAYCQLAGSVLAGKPHRKTSALVYGGPHLGKSTVNRTFKRLVGDEASGIVPKHYKDRFSWGFVENTAAWFGDDVDPKILFEPVYKELTGNDEFALRTVKKDFRKVKLRGVFFFNLNTKKLVLPNDEAVVNHRLIPCEISSSEEWEGKEKLPSLDDVDKLIDPELPYFAGYCLDAFEELNGKEIEYDRSNIRQYISCEDEMDYEEIFNTRYEFVKDWDVPDVGGTPTVSSTSFTKDWEAICGEYPNATKNKTHHGLRRWICEKLGIATPTELRKKARVNGKSEWCLLGIKRKTMTSDLRSVPPVPKVFP